MMRIHLAALSGAMLLAAACVESPGREGAAFHADTTYDKFLVAAEGGDASAQNLIGYMLYFGEGVEADPVEAHRWFHRAADRGHGPAAFNLAALHVAKTGALADPAEARRYYDRALDGGYALPGGARGTGARESLAATLDRIGGGAPSEDLQARSQYERYCAGCHGLNGVAAFGGSPSFAIGERLDKTDGHLLASISEGLGVMPYWSGKLSEAEQRAILAYIRGFPERYRHGIALGLRGVPERYFSFGPMAGTELGKRSQ